MSARDPVFDSSSPVLARWRANAPRAPAPRAPQAEPSPSPPPAPQDPRALLAALASKATTTVPEAVLAPLIQPLHDALDLAPAERDPEALALAFDRLEDLLEAFFCAGRSKPSGG